MTDCPHCRRFREERDEALEALRQASEPPADGMQLARCRAVLGLTPQPARVLLELLATQLASRERLTIVARVADWEDCSNGLNVILTKVRAALRPHGVTLINRHSLGWSIDAADRAKILAMLDAETQP